MGQDTSLAVHTTAPIPAPAVIYAQSLALQILPAKIYNFMIDKFI